MNTQTKDSIEKIISPSINREKYEEKRDQSSEELAGYDDFLQNIADAANDNNGTEEDILFVAEDAFSKL